MLRPLREPAEALDNECAQGGVVSLAPDRLDGAALSGGRTLTGSGGMAVGAA
jgi:hypothetical protein